MRLPSTLGLVSVLTLITASAFADFDGVGPIEDGVPAANAATGAPATKIDPDFKTRVIATGNDPLENPAGVFIKFGMLSTGTRTEPDQNTYLVLDHNPGGPSAGFDYGRHFLFQGHENGGGQAYITRINLDVKDPNHRITLLTPGNGTTTGFSAIDELLGTDDALEGKARGFFTQQHGDNVVYEFFRVGDEKHAGK